MRDLADPRRPSRKVVVLAATVLLAIVAGTIAAAVLLRRTPSGVGTGSPSPSTTETSSFEPSSQAAGSLAGEPSPSATGGPETTPDEASRPTLQGETLATVRVNGLNLRTDHSTAAPVAEWLGDKVQLNAGDNVLVLGPPVWGDGRWWHEIATDGVRQDQPLYDPVALIGFVAAGTRADPWLKEDNAWCPTGDSSLATLLSLTAVERLGCYRSTSLTFSAYAAKAIDGLGGVCEPPAPVPAWLICDGTNYNWVNRHGDKAWEFNLYFDPATGIKETGFAPDGPLKLRQITGHFDDPAAKDCVLPSATIGEGTVTRLTCRTHFVAEKVT